VWELESVLLEKGKCGFISLRSGRQTIRLCVFAGDRIRVELVKFAPIRFPWIGFSFRSYLLEITLMP
jgi:hypothetical protein